MPTEKIFAPDSLDAALELLNEYGYELLIVAGGTASMALVNQGLTSPRVAMTLNRAALNTTRAVNSHFEIGATTNLTRLSQMNELPLLAQAAKSVGGWAIRNMATIAGNLFVPPPAGDVATALLALDAQVGAAKKGKGQAASTRKIPLERFYTGFLSNALAPNELITYFEIPKPRGKTAFIKFGRRTLNTPAVITVAARIVTSPEGVITDARIALGAAHDYPFRGLKAEALLSGRALDSATIADAAEAARNEAKPFTDAIASDWYRKKMVGVMVKRALEQIAG